MKLLFISLSIGLCAAHLFTIMTPPSPSSRRPTHWILRLKVSADFGSRFWEPRNPQIRFQATRKLLFVPLGLITAIWRLKEQTHWGLRAFLFTEEKGKRTTTREKWRQQGQLPISNCNSVKAIARTATAITASALTHTTPGPHPLPQKATPSSSKSDERT
jgi:hypothetical protein